MGLHKLTAGDGYSYLTRQVAAHDSTEKGHTGLGDYYSQKGESPGVWAGRGAAALGLEGVVQDGQLGTLIRCLDPVTGERLRRHPKERTITSLSMFRASFGKASQIWMPLTLVAMGRQGPANSWGAFGFRSNIS